MALCANLASCIICKNQIHIIKYAFSLYCARVSLVVTTSHRVASDPGSVFKRSTRSIHFFRFDLLKDALTFFTRAADART